VNGGAPRQAPAAATHAADGDGLRPLWIALLLLGAALRLWQYAAGASQWLDELALSRGVLGLSWPALLSGPLPFAQVAPKGFTLLEKAGTELWGANDLGLRLLPLISSLAALWLFARLARRVLAHPAAVALAIALFALLPALICYAAQVKPYASDLAVALALTLLAAEMASAGERPAAGRLLLAGAAAAAAVLVSHAAALVLAGLGVALVAGTVVTGHRRGLAWLGITAGIWALAGGAAAVAASRELPPWVRDYLWHFWAPAFGPRPHTLAGDAHWLSGSLARLLGAGGLGYPWAPLYAGLAVLGVIALWRRAPALALLLFAPTAVALTAAELRLYPFDSRLVLFVVPALILAIAAGVEAIAAIRFARGRPARATAGTPGHAAALALPAVLVYVAALVPAIFGFGANPPVYRIEETRPLLRSVAARRQAGDAIYVYYGAGHALRFYGPRYGFQPEDYLLGGCHRGDTRAYLLDLDRFRGRRRVWVLFSHAQPHLGEEATMLAYLDRLGARLLTLRTLPHGRMFGLPAEAFLYDLSAATGRPPVAAASFPLVPGSNRLAARFACAGPANPFP
jgi:hypothetical protein